MDRQRSGLRGQRDELAALAAAWVDASCEAQGVAPKITEPGRVLALARLLGAATAVGSSGGATPATQASGARCQSR